MKNSGGNWNKKGVIKCLLAVVFMIAAIVGFTNSKSILSNVKQFFAAGDVPAHTKKIKENGDGTYKLSLDVTGDAEKKAQKANVIVIVDISNSMNDSANQTSTVYVEDNDNDSNRYGVVDGKYIALTRYNGSYWYRDANNDWVQYTGNRYRATTGNSRLQATKAAVDSLAQSLLSNNGKDGNPDDTVEMALVTFATRASTPINETTSARTFTNTVNDLSIAGSWAGATNWEAALTEANSVNFGANDNDPTFVIFFSDGAPTVRNTNHGHNDSYGHNYNNLYGSGYERNPYNYDDIQWDNMNWAYEESVDNATTLANKVGKDKFFTIFAFGEDYGATYMSNLTTAAGAPATNNYSAGNTAALQSAFDEILAKIEMSGINNVKIEDETTESVKIESTDTNGMLVVDNTSFTYTVTIPITEGKATIRGQEATLTGNTLKWGDKEVTGTIDSDGNFVYDWTGENDLTDIAPPEAKDNNGNVVWDLTAAGVLISGATYRVSFDVWPSQETYDLIADLKNGTKQYDTLPPEVKQYLSRDYILETNKAATLYYNDTRNTAGSQSDGYNNPPDVGTSSETIDVEKKWETAYDGRQPAPVTVTLNRDEETFLTVDLDGNVTADDKWETAPWTATKINIATGLARIKDGKLEILDEGHDYTFGELGSVSYNWELTSDIVHPMLINNEKYKLVLTETYPDMGGKDYILNDAGEPTYIKLSNGNVYKVSKTNPTIEATNHRRSNLNIKKVVDGVESDPNRDFEFTVKVTQKDENGEKIESVDTQYYNDYLWFSVQDEQGNWIDYGDTLGDWARSEGIDRETGKTTYYYYAPNGTELVINLKHGYNIRFTNLISNTDFDVKEGATNNYKLDSITSNDDNTASDKIDLDNKTIKGKISNTNKTYQVTYTNEYQKVDIPVEKIWTNDDNGSEGLRKAIEVKLYANDEEVDSATIGLDDNKNPLPGTTVEGNTWKYTFEDKDRFANEEEITYTISETVTPSLEPHYESTVNGYKITNTRNPDDIKTSVSGKKTWEDNEDQDGVRPDSIEIKLIANGDKTNPVRTTTVTADDDWKYAFDNLPKYKDGKEIKYTIIETPVTDYNDPEYDDSELNVINTHSPFETQVKVTKTWNDADNQDGIRPESISVSLLVVDKDGKKIPYSKEGLTNPVTLNEDNNWTATWTGLPRRAGGQDIKYEVSELDLPTGYESNQNEIEPTQETTSYSNGEKTYVSSETYALINTHEPETVTIPVKKIWNDNNDQDGIRPTSVQVQLYKDGTASGDPVTLNEANEWTYTWTDLAKYEFKEDGVTGGQLIEYTVQELTTTVITGTDGPNTYAFEVTGDVEEGYTVTNTHTPQTTEVPVVKVWEDADDQDGIRPESIDVQLYADGTATGDPVTLNEGNEWTYTWTDLAKNKNVNGTVSEIVYTVDETTVPTSYSKEITGDATEGFTITNKYTPGVVQVSVKKEWDDSENQDGIRPTSVEIQLFADGEESGKPITLNSENSWKYTWNDLPEKASGQAITYTVEEIETDVITGTDGSGTYAYKVTGDAEKGFTVKNTHTPDETEVSVTKVWVDGENQDGIRPTSVEVQLLANGEKSGAPVTLNESNSWTHTWEKLAVNKTGGNKITYTVEEVTTDVITGTDGPGKYAIAVTGDAEKGFTVTNTHTPDETEVSVEKKWEDKSNQDGIRPTSVQVQLLADGQPEGEPVTLNSRNSWKHTWEELAVNKTGGKKIAYTVQELTTDVITGTDGPGTYAIDITGDAEKGFTVTNTHTPDETEVSVEKKWEDKSNQDGIRPGSVQVQLLADGEESGEPVTLNSENNWKHTWEELAVNNSGNKITYTVEEVTTDKITGTDGPGTYAIDITGDAEKGFTVTNTHTPETTEVPVTKEWADAQDQDGIRPDDIEVQLFADGTAIGKAEVLNEANEWTYTWTKLDKFKDGKAIAYTVDEVEVPKGYTKESITGNAKEGFVIKNTHVTEDTAIKVTKKWEDADDQDGIRPDSVEVQLYADGEESGDPVTLNETNEWTKVWSKLDKFKDGEEIKYTVKETTTDVITGKDTSKTYAFEVTGAADTGYTVTNTHTPETTSVSGNKTWEDNNNQDGLRPETITINLLADGQLVNSKEFPVDPETGKCEYSFTTDSNGVDLPKYRDGGTEIVYTITENRVSDYEEPTYDGLDVTNKHNPFETEVSVKKSWDDSDDIDGKRPKFIYVTLYADDIPYAGSERVRLDASNGWSYTWSKLPRKASGTDIVYTVRELVVPEGYTSNVNNPDVDPTSTKTKDGTTYIIEEAIEITNNHTPDETEVSVEKKWEDNNNQDGIRPAGVEIKLLADGKATDYSVVLSEQNEWKHTWTGLQKYEFDKDGNGGKEIAYTVEESPVPDKYTAEITGTATEGFTVTNKYKPEETSLKVTKVWDDQGDQDGIRPQSIQVQLTADGTAQGDPITLDESNSWTYTWTGLDKNKNVDGDVSAIIYKADEVVVPQGYEKTTTGDMTKGITITNKYTPKVINVEGTKTWDDSNNVDGKRPSSITVYVKDGDSIVDTITVTGDATAESWTFKSKDLPQYRNHGKEEIKYTIEEETKGLVEIGYSVEINGTNITNKRTPEVIEKFPITKSWIDNSNSEGFRPNSVDIQLLADGQPYGDPITIGTDKDGNPLEGTTIEGNNWKYVFKNLPKYTHDENGNGGKEIVYSIKEVNLDANYKAEQVDNRTIVNTIDAMKKDIPVKKIWDDASNQDGYRPDSIEFTLTGTVESETKPVYTETITLNGESDTWEGKFVDAPIFYKGTLITYTVNEVVTKDLQKYYLETKEETVEGVYTITNKHVPEVTEVTIGKTWDDKDDQDGKRPSSIEVTLTGNGKTYGPVRIGLDENGNPLEGTEVNGNTWTYTFTGLPKKADGKDIEYVVSESNVDNYNQLSIISNVITNQHIPATISYSVEKEWKDYDNQDGKRPEFITVTLTGKVGDTVVYTSTITVKPDENGDWKYSFTGLNKYYQKQLIQYTLTEGNVDLYETDPIVDIPNEEGTTTINNTIINRHELETIDITVKKVWDDLDNKYNHRTTFVTVHLFADGEEVKEAMLSEANGWTTIFEGLVKYREGKEGEEVEYTITEDAVEFYKTSIAEADNVFTITNTYDGPTESEIVPPKTGILPTKDYTFFELLMNLILLSYSLVYLKKVEN